MIASGDVLLRDRVSKLEEENRQLRRLLTPKANIFYRGFRFTRTERVLVGLLTARDYVLTPDMILSAFEQRAGVFNETLTPKCVHVMVCRVRKKLAPHGIHIATEYGTGYYMTVEDKDKLAVFEGGLPA